jgi:arabinose-5-phosphate isomerase
MDTIEIAKKALRAEAAMLSDLAEQVEGSIINAVELLVNCNGHVITSGVGTTGIAARRFAHLLCNVGCPALFLHAGDSLHGSSGAVKTEDVVVLFSRTGETTETIKLAAILAKRNTSMISLTAHPDSSLGRLSNVTIQVETSPDVDPYGGLMAVGSSLAMEAMCDAMVHGVLEMKKTPAEHFVNGHPGGIIQQMSEEIK